MRLPAVPRLSPSRESIGLPQSFNLDKRRKITDAFVNPTNRDDKPLPTHGLQPPASTSEQLPDHQQQNLTLTGNQQRSLPLTEGQCGAVSVKGGNAAEAHRLRGIMGFNRKELNKPAFAFSFLPASTSTPVPSFDVFVGGMPYKWSHEDVKEFWSECGTVLDVDCMTFRDTGRFKGIARITYATNDGYENALQCDGDTWDGCSFVVKPWKEKTVRAAPTKDTSSKQLPRERLGKRVEGFNVLFLCNLPSSMTTDGVIDLFRDFDLEAVKLKQDPESGRSKGYAHIHFRRSEQLEAAIQMLDNTVIKGRTVRLGYAIPPPNWKPKKAKTERKNGSEGLEAYAIGDGRYLVRLSGLQPTTRRDDVQAMFSDVSLLDVQLIWSARNGQGSGAVYLMVGDSEGLQAVLKKNDTFYKGRRLHVRPGELSDYQRKTRRSKKTKRRRQKPEAEMDLNGINDDDHDPLLALL